MMLEGADDSAAAAISLDKKKVEKLISVIRDVRMQSLYLTDRGKANLFV